MNREEFEKWADSENLDPQDKDQYGYLDRATGMAALAWQASAANEREKMVKMLREDEELEFNLREYLSDNTYIHPDIIGETDWISVLKFIADHLEKELL